MENTIENAKQFVYDNSNFNTDLGMGYIMAKMCVDYANKLNKPCVSSSCVCPNCKENAEVEKYGHCDNCGNRFYI